MNNAERERERRKMISTQLAARGIADKAVLEAMAQIPREDFVLERYRPLAYEDAALPIACGQTISQPYIVARMLALVSPKPDNTALEVGAGSGYAAAILGKLCKKVYAIERHKPLADAARRAIEKLQIHNVEIIHADGTKGLPEKAPFDVMIVSAGGREIPEHLTEQLGEGGRLVIPLGVNGYQVLTVVRRNPDGTFERTQSDAVKFVPLISGTEDD